MIRKTFETNALVTKRQNHLFCKKEIPKPEMIKNIESKSALYNSYNSFNFPNLSATPTQSEGNKYIHRVFESEN